MKIYLCTELHDFTRGKCRNVDFRVGISFVSLPSIETADDTHTVESGEGEQTTVVNSVQSVDLSSSNVGFVFVVSSVLIEPVIDVDLEINVVTEVAGTRRCHEESGLVFNQVTLVQLLAQTLIVFGKHTEFEAALWNNKNKGIQLILKYR